MGSDSGETVPGFGDDRCTRVRHDVHGRCPCYEDWNDPPRPSLWRRMASHFGRDGVSDA